ncbi:MAG: carboxymuconolactone decarboxylase family protein [Candidatus Rokuibacteriota bacterium]
MDIRHAVGVRVGLPESKLAALARYRDSAEFAPREVAALEFAEQVARDDQEVSEACWAQLREHFSEAEAVELMFIVGYQTFASKFAKAFALVPQGLASQAFVPQLETAPAEAAGRV